MAVGVVVVDTGLLVSGGCEMVRVKSGMQELRT